MREIAAAGGLRPVPLAGPVPDRAALGPDDGWAPRFELHGAGSLTLRVELAGGREGARETAASAPCDGGHLRAREEERGDEDQDDGDDVGPEAAEGGVADAPQRLAEGAAGTAQVWRVPAGGVVWPGGGTADQGNGAERRETAGADPDRRGDADRRHGDESARDREQRSTERGRAEQDPGAIGDALSEHAAGTRAVERDRDQDAERDQGEPENVELTLIEQRLRGSRGPLRSTAGLCAGRLLGHLATHLRRDTGGSSPTRRTRLPLPPYCGGGRAPGTDRGRRRGDRERDRSCPAP